MPYGETFQLVGINNFLTGNEYILDFYLPILQMNTTATTYFAKTSAWDPDNPSTLRQIRQEDIKEAGSVLANPISIQKQQAVAQAGPGLISLVEQLDALQAKSIFADFKSLKKGFKIKPMFQKEHERKLREIVALALSVFDREMQRYYGLVLTEKADTALLLFRHIVVNDVDLDREMAIRVKASLRIENNEEYKRLADFYVPEGTLFSERFCTLVDNQIKTYQRNWDISESSLLEELAETLQKERLEQPEKKNEWDQIGQVVKLWVDLIEARSDRRQKLRALINFMKKACSYKTDLDWLLLADQLKFPGWAIECLPSLFVVKPTNREDKVEVILWHFIAVLIDQDRVEFNGDLAEGKVCRLNMDTTLLETIRPMAESLEQRRRGFPFASDHAMQGAITDFMALLEIEAKSQNRLQDANKIQQERERFIQSIRLTKTALNEEVPNEKKVLEFSYGVYLKFWAQINGEDISKFIDLN